MTDDARDDYHLQGMEISGILIYIRNKSSGAGWYKEAYAQEVGGFQTMPGMTTICNT